MCDKLAQFTDDCFFALTFAQFTEGREMAGVLLSGASNELRVKQSPARNGAPGRGALTARTCRGAQAVGELRIEI
jgi:hypothetical protein